MGEAKRRPQSDDHPAPTGHYALEQSADHKPPMKMRGAYCVDKDVAALAVLRNDDDRWAARLRRPQEYRRTWSALALRDEPRVIKHEYHYADYLAGGGPRMTREGTVVNESPEQVVPTALRRVFMAVGVASGIALVVVVAIFVLARVHVHENRDATQANESAAAVKATATARSFYQRLLAAEASGPLTAGQLEAMSHGIGIAVQSPVADGDSVLVDFRVSQGYVRAGEFEGGEGVVQQCYRATLSAPGRTSGMNLLDPTSCFTTTY